MIQQKLKPCKHDGHLAYLFSHGYCKYHWMLITAKKHITEKKESGVSDKDSKFYKYIWDNSDKHCIECGKELHLPEKGDARNFIHHLLPKRKGAGGYPYFRYEPKNVVLLCWSDHQKAESAISYPKMKIFEPCEIIKAELLESVGLTYESKITIP